MPVSQHCARPGCSGSTAAWLTYDYEARTVWLDDRDSQVGGSRLGLCAAHGDRLRVPLRWTRRDRRTAARPTPDPGHGRADGPADGPETASSPDAVAV